MTIAANSTALAADFVSTSAGAGDSGKVPKLNASGQLDDSFFNKVVPIIRTYSTTGRVGDSTTRFDITNPSGTTFRYTFDGTGTNPTINSTTFPTGAFVNINSGNFNAANNGLFTITASDTNYFEVTNASGVAENDKTLGTANSFLIAGTKWTKPANLSYIVVEMVGGGGGASSTTTSTYNGTPSYFKTASLYAANGGNADSNTGGSGGGASGGDINIDGAYGSPRNSDSNGGSSFGWGSRGGLTVLGTKGKGGDMNYTGDSTIGAAGGGGGYFKKIYAASALSSTEPLCIGAGGANAGSSTNAGAGGFGIITEYYI